MAQQHIHCTVNTCHYYGQGNKCLANEIVVVNDQFGNAQPDNVDATQASTFPPTPADTCMQTCCKSFVHKGSAQINADGVTKSQSNYGGNQNMMNNNMNNNINAMNNMGGGQYRTRY